MTSAVRTIAGERVEVRRELFPRCGPTDERLDGLVLQLIADTPSRSVDLVDVTAELRDRGLTVERGSGPLLRMTPEGQDWAVEVWPGEDGLWRITARAEVDDDSATPLRPLTAACG